MSFKSKFNALASLTILFALLLACGGNETPKANALVDEANKSIQEGNTAFTDASSKNTAMISAAAQDMDNKSGADETIAAFQKASDAYLNASKKFDEASKFNIQDKFKEYLQAKAQEMKKRSDICSEAKGMGEALKSSSNLADFRDKVKAITDKIDGISKEAKDLEDKADKIQKENKEIFKS